jgi:hypothetical protein
MSSCLGPYHLSVCSFNLDLKILFHFGEDYYLGHQNAGFAVIVQMTRLALLHLQI